MEKQIESDTKKQMYYEDEIDLFELFAKIWKWKWLIIVIVIFSTAMTFVYVKSRPDTYTVTATVKIGKVAKLNIEDIEDFKIYLESDEFLGGSKCLFSRDINVKALTCTLTYTAHSPDESFKCMEGALQNILKRHGDLYNKAISELKRSLLKGDHVREPAYVLDSYNYPTRIISKPVKPAAPDSKRMRIKLIAAVVASLFIGIFLSFFIEYLSAEIRRRRIS